VVFSDGSSISFTSGYNLSSIYYVRLGYDDDGRRYLGRRTRPTNERFHKALQDQAETGNIA
jgi:hypothetical protein